MSENTKREMKISNEKPPIYDEAIAAGMQFNPATTIFTFGDTIYNPANIHLSDHLIAHEETHSKQQGHTEEGAYAWWNRYLIDPYFRMEQEADAYARQYEFICKTNKDRNHRHRILMDLARFLCGPMYGNMISQLAAYDMIKKKAKKV